MQRHDDEAVVVGGQPEALAVGLHPPRREANAFGGAGLRGLGEAALLLLLEERLVEIERPLAAGSPTTEVLAIYPSVEVLPVNHLRLYVHFSAPMSEDWAARAVHLRRADDGEPLAGVFLEGPELWDGERRRLTLLLDPGRIKRALVPNQQSGYPLIEGVPVVVRIDAAFRDAEGWPIDAIAERR